MTRPTLPEFSVRNNTGGRREPSSGVQCLWGGGGHLIVTKTEKQYLLQNLLQTRLLQMDHCLHCTRQEISSQWIVIVSQWVSDVQCALKKLTIPVGGFFITLKWGVYYNAASSVKRWIYPTGHVTFQHSGSRATSCVIMHPDPYTLKVCIHENQSK